MAAIQLSCACKRTECVVVLFLWSGWVVHKNHLISFLERSCFRFETLIPVATNSWNLIKNIKWLFHLQMLKHHFQLWTLARQLSHLAVTSPPTLPASDVKVSSHTCNLNVMWHDVERWMCVWSVCSDVSLVCRISNGDILLWGLGWLQGI